MHLTVDEKKLYLLIKKAVSEVIAEKLKELKLEIIPYADDAEMEEIKTIFESPEKYKNQKFTKLVL